MKTTILFPCSYFESDKPETVFCRRAPRRDGLAPSGRPPLQLRRVRRRLKPETGPPGRRALLYLARLDDDPEAVLS